MAKVYFQGKLKYRVKSYFAISVISIQVMGRRLIRRPLVKAWSAMFEIGVLFWRHQFNSAFKMEDFNEGRAYFDSLITSTGETFALTEKETVSGQPKGRWLIPIENKSSAHLLYLHGGGYSFRSEVSVLYAKTLAGKLNLPLFMPEYRLTPEHPYPAQIEDGLAAYKFMLSEGIRPKDIVLIGDSAGGHLVLMLLQAIMKTGLTQPALTIGLCPWTDIGERGDSLYGNDKYDLVQGYMAVQFGKWLKGSTGYTREQMSPIHQNYVDLAPLYLQGGGREVLIDMIRDFAKETAMQGAEVVLDVWPDMTHNFQAHGDTHPDSIEALNRISFQIDIKVNGSEQLSVCHRTEISGDIS